ncbi:MAG: hypothetical protein O3A87_07965 [Verrucomicrobia bacterium]|nr:hypothetical protein [Verrucomicrobiota bacterium]
MKTLLFLFCTGSLVHGELLRVSKASEARGLNAEAMALTKDGRSMIYQVEKEAVVTGKDVASARAVADQPGVVEVKLNEEGAKRLAAATKGAGGKVRLAIIVDGVLESVPLVLGQMKDTLWVSGLENLDEADLTKLAKAFEAEAKGGEKEKDGVVEDGVEKDPTPLVPRP